jgi:hypothetical protein
MNRWKSQIGVGKADPIGVRGRKRPSPYFLTRASIVTVQRVQLNGLWHPDQTVQVEPKSPNTS